MSKRIIDLPSGSLSGSSLSFMGDPISGSLRYVSYSDIRSFVLSGSSLTLPAGVISGSGISNFIPLFVGGNYITNSIANQNNNIISISGSLAISSSLIDSTNSTGSFGKILSVASNGTIIWISQVSSSISASYALSSSFATTSSFSTSSSFALSALTSSYSTNITGSTNFIPLFSGVNSLTSSNISQSSSTVLGIGYSTINFGTTFTIDGVTATPRLLSNGQLLLQGNTGTSNQIVAQNQVGDTLNNAAVFAITSGTHATNTTGSLTFLNIFPNQLSQTTGSQNVTFISLITTLSQSSGYTGIVRGIYYNPTISAPLVGTHIAYENIIGNNILNSASGSTFIGFSNPNAISGGLSGSFKLAVFGNTLFSGSIADTTRSTGSYGQVLQSTGNGVLWVSTVTSSLTSSYSNNITGSAGQIPLFATNNSLTSSLLQQTVSGITASNGSTFTMGNGVVFSAGPNIIVGSGTLNLQSNGTSGNQVTVMNGISNGFNNGSVFAILGSSGVALTNLNGSLNFFSLTGTISHVSGGQNITIINANPTISQSAAYTGSVIGIQYAPTLQQQPLVGTHIGFLNTIGHNLFNTASGSTFIGFLNNTSSLNLSGSYKFLVSGTMLSFTNNLGTTVADTNGIYLLNQTSASNNAQQISPSITFEGQGWSTTSTASQSTRMKIYMLPTQGTTTAGDSLVIAASLNGAAYVTRATLSGTSLVLGASIYGASSATINGNVSAAGLSLQNFVNDQQHNFQGNFIWTGSANFSFMELTGSVSASAGITSVINIDPTYFPVGNDFRAINIARGRTVLAAATSSYASLNIASGSVPTSPKDGDIWYDSVSGSLKMQISGSTKTFTIT